MINLTNLILSEPVDMPAPLGFENWLTFWMVIGVSCLSAVLLCFAGYKFLQILQLSNYRITGYFAWIKQDKGAYWGRLLALSFLSCASLLITNVLLENFFVYKIMTWLGLVFYFVFVSVFILNQSNLTNKTPLKYTKRMTRLCIVLFALIFIATVFMLNFSTIYIPYFKYGMIGITPVLLPIFIILAHAICWPFEKLIAKHYISRAKAKLETRKDLVKIGITGSYGKTSVKNILTSMLAEKYEVCASPYSYNTPMGITKTIEGSLLPKHKIFVCEMGARYVGDIKELCDIVNPEIGVLTGIGNQHLATFKTQENLTATKMELAKHLKKNGGTLFANMSSEITLNAVEKSGVKCIKSCLDDTDAEVRISGIKITSTGSEFVLCYKENNVKCKTTLLGKHNISNILLCAKVALKLGVTLDEISHAISKLTPVAHRLALVPSSNSLIIIDDAYNGSVEGAKAGLDVLKQFDGKKFVITPGLVELGSAQFDSNFELGKQMAEVADYVVIDGITNYDAISSGLAFAKFDPKKILRAGSVTQAVQVLNGIASAGDVVLFENDLPDNLA